MGSPNHSDNATQSHHDVPPFTVFNEIDILKYSNVNNTALAMLDHKLTQFIVLSLVPLIVATKTHTCV